MNICGVYRILNVVNLKKYVGSAVNIDRRWETHIQRLKDNIHPNKHLQSAWNKYGEENFKFEILEICDPEQLIEREQSYLPEEKTHAALKERGFYNTSPLAGTSRGSKLSEDTKQKMRDSSFLKGKPGRKNFLGRNHTDETKKTISLKTKGLKRTEETKAKIKEKRKSQEPFDAEARKKMSEASLNYWHTGEPKKFSESHKQALREAWKRRKEKTKEIIDQATKINTEK